MSFGEIFQPGLRHLREEKERQKMAISKPTPGGGAPFGIDLEAGIAKITVARPARRPEPADPAEAAPGSSAPSDDADLGAFADREPPSA